jgi:hypothetical protein
VLNYNTTTGEYDGYIGRRDPSDDDILEFGDIVRARKDIPAKFYDATNIDYIELVFEELKTSSPGKLILSTNDPRFVDIELFPSLALDDEVFLIASCQLNENIVERVSDRREFGTISEKNFSDSAIKFIESGDRYLHANGVLRGLDYQGPDPSDSSLYTFNGGVALVNGHISVVNDGNVRIPEVRSGASGQVVEWAICVNDTGQFEPIIVTDSKEEFFVSNVTPSYYIPSVTYAELINQRKDLTPIAVISVSVSSLSLVSVTDIRKSVGSETANLPFTLSQPTSRPNTSADDEGFIGNFSTFEQLGWWLRNLQEGGPGLVKVRGNITVDADDFAFTSLAPVTFDGEGRGGITFQNGTVVFDGLDITFRNMNLAFEGTSTSWNSGGEFTAEDVNFVTDSSISLRKNVTIRDCSFVYEPSSVGTSNNNFINSDLGACLSFDLGNVEDVLITNCSFFSNFANRPPFILMQRPNSGTVDNVTISNCRFNDTLAVDHAAIVLEWIDTSPSNAKYVGPGIWSDCQECAGRKQYLQLYRVLGFRVGQQSGPYHSR